MNIADKGFGCFGVVVISIIFYLILVHWFPLDFVIYSLEDNFNEKSGYIGDTIGGILSPLIAIIASILTFLAFYIQVKANRQIQDQFLIQKFESQFYEMVRLHKENVNELSINAIQKRQIEVNHFGIAQYEDVPIKVSHRKVFIELVKELEFIILAIKEFDDGVLTPWGYNKAYQSFFFGFSSKVDYNLSLAEAFSDENLNSVENYLIKLQKFQRNYMENVEWDISNELLSKLISLNVDLGKGHSDFLSHYFRHLYHTVKFVAESDIEYKDKIRYLRILRAQLSNQEQAMIFYNWIHTDYGGKWENDKNRYFTEYCMIHNLWHDRLLQDDYIKGKLKKLIGIIPKYRKGELFEIKFKG